MRRRHFTARRDTPHEAVAGVCNEQRPIPEHGDPGRRVELCGGARAVAKPGTAPAGERRHDAGAVDHADRVVVGVGNDQMDGRGVHRRAPTVVPEPWEYAVEPCWRGPHVWPAHSDGYADGPVELCLPSGSIAQARYTGARYRRDGPSARYA